MDAIATVLIQGSVPGNPSRPNRRRFVRRLVAGSVAAAGLGLLAGCDLRLIPAQPATKKVPRVGFLGAAVSGKEAFRQGLRDFGYVEGQNILVEYRSGGGNQERLDALAQELVGLKVDVLVTAGAPATLAARRATVSIPIVVAFANLLESGAVANLARPGGNITGFDGGTTVLTAKRLELLKELVPGLSRVALVWDPAFPDGPARLREAEAAAPVLGLQLHSVPLSNTADLPGAYRSAAEAGAGAVLLAASPVFINELEVNYRLPTMYGANQGEGLITFGANFDDLSRRSVEYLDQILKGAKPADLPVQLPTRYDLRINLKTAQALGITLPQSILVQATEMIR